jgi:hypothetical protein
MSDIQFRTWSSFCSSERTTVIDYGSRPSHAVGFDLDDLSSLYVSAKGNYQSVANSGFQLAH